MKLTRRTFLKFLGLAVVPVAALAKLSKPAKEKPYLAEKKTTNFICRATGERLYVPDEMFTEAAGISLQPHQTIEEYLKEKQNHNAHQARIKSLARAMRQTQEIRKGYLYNIINRKV